MLKRMMGRWGIREIGRERKKIVRSLEFGVYDKNARK
jgi:hypothetical protein